jgi:hypothetical protein
MLQRQTQMVSTIKGVSPFNIFKRRPHGDFACVATVQDLGKKEETNQTLGPAGYGPLFGPLPRWRVPGRQRVSCPDASPKYREASLRGESVERPSGVTIIAVLMLIAAGFLALGSLVFFFVGVMDMTGADAAEPISTAIAAMGVSGGLFFLILAGAYVLLAIGVLELRNWARLGCMVSIGLGVALAVMSFILWVGHPVAPRMVCQFVVIALDVWILWYLVRPHVKQAFGTAIAQ